VLSECKVIPVIPPVLDHPVTNSSPFSPLTHGQKIATAVSGDTVKKKGGRWGAEYEKEICSKAQML